MLAGYFEQFTMLNLFLPSAIVNCELFFLLNIQLCAMFHKFESEVVRILLFSTLSKLITNGLVFLWIDFQFPSHQTMISSWNNFWDLRDEQKAKNMRPEIFLHSNSRHRLKSKIWTFDLFQQKKNIEKSYCAHCEGLQLLFIMMHHVENILVSGNRIVERGKKILFNRFNFF